MGRKSSASIRFVQKMNRQMEEHTNLTLKTHRRGYNLAPVGNVNKKIQI